MRTLRGKTSRVEPPANDTNDTGNQRYNTSPKNQEQKHFWNRTVRYVANSIPKSSHPFTQSIIDDKTAQGSGEQNVTNKRPRNKCICFSHH